MTTFTPLRVRSHGTLLAGTASPEQLVERALELGHDALALTDRDNLYLVVRFLQACAKAHLHALPGAELTHARASVLLLAADRRGWANLCALLTARRLDPAFDLVRAVGERHAGLQVIAESPALAAALLAAGVPPAVRADDERSRPLARRAGLWLGVRGLPSERAALRAKLAEGWRLGVPAVATGDVLMRDPGDHEAHRVAVTAAAGELLERMPPSAFGAREAWLASPEEWARRVRATCAGAGSPDAADELLANNAALVARCRCEVEMGTPIFPRAPLPDGVAADGRLRALALAGVPRRYPAPAARRVALVRLDDELALIARMGFTDYFLLVANIVGFAQSRGIPSVGRGSGASSIVSYLLGVTSVDPIRYGLCFERFLHPQRRDCPDLDVDLCWRRRDEVIAHVYETYGHDRVAMISTHATLGPRSAFREAAKALGIPLPRVNALARRVPRGELPDASALEKTLHAGHADEFREPRVAEALRLAAKLAGAPRHLSIHCGGLVIGDRELTHYLPLERAAKGVVVSQFEMRAVEAIGLVKMDLLGNRAITSIGECMTLATRAASGADAVDADASVGTPDRDRSASPSLGGGRADDRDAERPTRDVEGRPASVASHTIVEERPANVASHTIIEERPASVASHTIVEERPASVGPEKADVRLGHPALASLGAPVAPPSLAPAPCATPPSPAPLAPAAGEPEHRNVAESDASCDAEPAGERSDAEHHADGSTAPDAGLGATCGGDRSEWDAKKGSRAGSVARMAERPERLVRRRQDAEAERPLFRAPLAQEAPGRPARDVPHTDRPRHHHPAMAQPSAPVIAQPSDGPRTSAPEPVLDPERIPEDDPATARIVATGDTLNCFQLESPAMRHLLRMLRADTLDASVAAVALVRPGPAESGMKETFCRRARGLDPVAYPHERLRATLAETHGVMLYEEDVMRVASALCGLPLAEGETLRRAIGAARDDEEFRFLERGFLAQAVRAGVDEASARAVWRELARFAGYAFCKAHAAGYGRLAWQSAYAKVHFPAAWAAAILNHHAGMYPTWVHVEDLRRHDVTFRPPCVHASAWDSTLAPGSRAGRGGTVQVGLHRVLGLSHATGERLLAERARGAFAHLADFADRVRPTPPELESLVLAGALDWTGRARAALLLEARIGVALATKAGASARRDAAPRLDGGSGALVPAAHAPRPGGEALPELAEFALADRVRGEFANTGLWFAAHPLEALAPPEARRGCVGAGTLERHAGRRVAVCGIPCASRRVEAKSGGFVLFVTLADATGLAECVLFPRDYARLGPALRGEIVRAEGRVDETLGALTLVVERASAFGAGERRSEGAPSRNRPDALTARAGEAGPPSAYRVAG